MRWSREQPGPESPPLAGLVITAMRLADVDEVLRIERVSYPSPWRRVHFVHEIEHNPWAVNRVARRGKELAAYLCAWRLHEEFKINNVAVRPEHRGRGVGRWFLALVLVEAWSTGSRLAQLEVRPSNTAALALYRSFGFQEVGRRTRYYEREGEDAILMELAAPGAVP